MKALILSVGLAVMAIQPASAIVYGEADDTGQFPNVGAMLLEIEGELTQWCTGTLIAPGVFLTAAHCTAAVTDEGLTASDVRLTFDAELPGDLIEIHGWFQDPRFTRRASNPHDLAVLYFDANHPDAAGLEPAPVAGPRYLNDLGKRALRVDRFNAVGYGAVRSSRKKGPQGIVAGTERRFAVQSVQSMTKAWLTLAMNDRAVTNGGTCHGDSGGPHIHEGVVVSVTIVGDAVCKATDRTYRLDTPWAQDFLDEALAGA